MNVEHRLDLLEYAAPGFLHGLGNALFKIQAHAQVIDTEPALSGPEAGPGILAACKDATGAIEIFRAVLDPEAHADPVQAGGLLEDMLQMMRGRMREDGVQVLWDQGSLDIPQAVRPRDVVAPVLIAMRQLALALPGGTQGVLTVSVRWERGLDLSLDLAPAPGSLPFEVNLEPAVRSTSASLQSGEVCVGGGGRGLRVKIPVGVAV